MSKTEEVYSSNRLVTSSRAAQLSGYSQDYVGQLCRGGSISCRRVSGEWQVDLQSLLAYKKRFNPTFSTPESSLVTDKQTNSATELSNSQVTHKDIFTKDGKDYIASADAADVTGYSQDYIGQLARSGAIEAQKVGRKWFVGESSLLAHKKHNDGLLAALQSKSVGLASTNDTDASTTSSTIVINKIPAVTYKRDDGTDMPVTSQQDGDSRSQQNHGNSIQPRVMDLRQSKNGRHTAIHKASTSHANIETSMFDSSKLSKHTKRSGNKTRAKNTFLNTYLPIILSIAGFVFIMSAVVYPDTLSEYLTGMPYLGSLMASTEDSALVSSILDLFTNTVGQ